jgi:hypothetical protein
LVLHPAQIIVKDRKAEIHPIAGTLKEQVMMKRRYWPNYPTKKKK